MINADDPSADVFRAWSAGVDRVLTYALAPRPGVDVWAEDVEYLPDATHLTLAGPDGARQAITTSMFGAFNVANILAASAAALALLDDDLPR